MTRIDKSDRIPLLWLEYKRLTSIVLFFSLPGSSCMLVLMERATWKGTEGCCWPLARKELRPSVQMSMRNSSFQQPLDEPGNKFCPSWTLRWLWPPQTPWLRPYERHWAGTMTAASWPVLKHSTQLNCAWISDSQKLWENKCVLVYLIKFCYTAMSN